jgi:hypothetical protein
MVQWLIKQENFTFLCTKSMLDCVQRTTWWEIVFKLLVYRTLYKKPKKDLRWTCQSNDRCKCKGKVVSVLNWAPRHEGVREWMYSSTQSLTSVLDGDEWSASPPGRFTPRERAFCTHLEAGWAPESVWTWCRGDKFPASTENQTLNIRSSSS